MHADRIFPTAEHWEPSPGEPVRHVVTQGADAVVVSWHVAPGQAIHPHVHPKGQDTWIVMSGTALYITDAQGSSRRIRAGDIAVAAAGQVHGARNDGAEPLCFISVVAPVDAGFEPL
jgi:quercetin dioxygenase-like cupin family protein